MIPGLEFSSFTVALLDYFLQPMNGSGSKAQRQGLLTPELPKYREQNPYLRTPSDLSYLCPLGHLPLGAAGRALAGPPLHGPLQVGGGAEVAVDRAVQARRDHLPAADLTELETLPAGPGALAPAARLPPENDSRSRVRGSVGSKV